MYFNKMINAFFFFFLFLRIQCFAPPISAGASQLSVDYYKKSCPYVDDIVLGGVWNATLFDPRVPASLLRLFFHDCFVDGCEASVLLDDLNGEKTARPNINSLRGFEVIDQIKKRVENKCPNIVSCADILALAARAAVEIALYEKQKVWPEKLPWPVKLGRLDGFTSNKAGANRKIPSTTEPIDSIMNKFLAQGLTIKDMVVLSGAHTIGYAKCSTIKGNRLYPSSSYQKENNYKMDAHLLWELRSACPNVELSDNYTVPLDWNTTYAFDNDYYSNLLNDKGILLSDQVLTWDVTTYQLVIKYSKDQNLFLKDFVRSMGKMGDIGVITKGTKVTGEIRTKCGSRN